MNGVIFKSAVISLATFASLFYADYKIMKPIQICIPLALLSGIFYYLVANAIRKENELSEAKRDFRNFLYAIIAGKSVGIPIIKAISGYKTSNPTVAKVADEVKKKLMLGADVFSAINSSAERRRMAINIMPSSSGQEYLAIENALRHEESALNEKIADQVAYAQRDATINMFISTIAPAFIIFIFTGNLILSGSAGSIVLFSIVMLVLLPISNVLTTSLLVRRSYA